MFQIFLIKKKKSTMGGNFKKKYILQKNQTFFSLSECFCFIHTNVRWACGQHHHAVYQTNLFLYFSLFGLNKKERKREFGIK